MRRAFLLIGVLGLTLGGFSRGVQANTPPTRSPISLHVARPHQATVPEPGSMASRSLLRGYLVPDEPAYRSAKEAAARAVGSPERSGSLAMTTVSPDIPLAWEGLRDDHHTPSDSTGAIGTTRYLEAVNTRVGIYDRTGRLEASGSLGRWWHTGRATTADPQIIWDPGTQRFYYAGVALFTEADHELAFGWSRTSSPAHVGTGWCSYTVRYGSELPDYPKLGDSADFALIGVNVFDDVGFRGADVVAIGKPGKPVAGEACPTPGTDPIPFGVGQNLSLLGVDQFTPVPANQIDTGHTGYVLTQSPYFAASTLGLFTVTAAADGSPVIGTHGRSVTVPSYSVPPNAPQADSRFQLDTLDGRLTQGVSARDPARGGSISLWTQHTVAGGAGSIVRWYEIDPGTATVVQTGDAASDALYAFNGAIAPDRAVDAGSKRFGSSMVMGFNTSSSTTYPAIAMLSKVGAGEQSGWAPVHDSPGPDLDFACPRLGSCRWGDYMAATPDPRPAVGADRGRVWLTGMWTVDGRVIRRGTSWRTWNWVAAP